ncbi:hypothetical protein EC957_003285 [Mortierella hygrophila]|uniref:NAD(P)-binding domain-containing protein n=1 Tax=Mortierella hygrophila TaxID=979708 RepID=A0A9P6F334_9FUNG|nr:hypothetical protein EC957_003285 [Mortierella hygrophila]
MTSTLTGSKPSILQDPTLAITNCDSFEGQTLALALADYLEHKHINFKKVGIEGGDHDHNKPTKPAPPVVSQLVCLTRDKNKCGDLNKRDSCKVVQISYEDPNTIVIALQGIQTVVFVPEIEPQRVDWADRIVDAMKQENVTRCITISSIGTDASDKDQLDRFRRVEDRVKKDIPRWTILREGFPFQALFYWIPMVQDQGVLGMPIKQDIEFAPLDITDLGRALISVTFPSKNHPDGSDGGKVVLDEFPLDDDIRKSLAKLNLTDAHSHGAHEAVSTFPVTSSTGITPAGPGDGDDRHDGQIYTLTGPETVTGPKLAHALTCALKSDKKHKDKHPEPIVFKELAREEFRDYLLTLRNKSGGAIPMTTAGFQPVTSFLQFFQHMTDAVKGGHHHHPQPLAKEKDEKLSSSAPTKFASQFDVAKTTAAEGNDDDDVALIDALSNDDSCPGCKSPKKGHEPMLKAPNDTEIDLVLELLDYINENRATFQSGDLQKITGERGNNAKAFFEEHACNFHKRQSTAADKSSSPSFATASTVHSEGQ